MYGFSRTGDLKSQWFTEYSEMSTVKLQKFKTEK